jgi:hypothetical protein
VRYLLLVVVAGLAGLAFVNHEKSVSADQPTLNAIASAISHRDVQVRCPSFFKRLIDVSGDAGKVEFGKDGKPSDHTSLSSDVCSSLAGFKKLVANGSFSCITGNTCERTVEKAIIAVHTLSHESFHLAGYSDEAVAECYGLQTDQWTAARLGAPPDVAQQIARYYVQNEYPQVPTEYHSNDCRPGGRLDLGRGWP